MLVKELIEHLAQMPQEIPVALCVYSHIYGQPHEASHGRLMTAIAKSNGVPTSLFLGPMLDYEVKRETITLEAI